MINLKDKWRELSISKKFTIVFALQNFSLFLAWLFLDANFVFLFFLGFGMMLYSYNVGDEWTKNEIFVFSIIAVSFWLFDNNGILRTNLNVDYKQLKNYFGRTEVIHIKGVHSMRLLSELNHKSDFECALGEVIDSSTGCGEELRNYFGRKNIYDQNISVKYFQLNSDNIVYEMKHDDKVIYDYNYFVSKYHKQQRNSIIYAVYLIANTLVFCIFYHLIQKNSVQHTQ